MLSQLVLQPRQAYNVTILNRSYPSGRHIVNTEAIAAQVSAMDGISDCRSHCHWVHQCCGLHDAANTLNTLQNIMLLLLAMCELVISFGDNSQLQQMHVSVTCTSARDACQADRKLHCPHCCGHTINEVLLLPVLNCCCVWRLSELN